jgi:hypothetical protein
MSSFRKWLIKKLTPMENDNKIDTTEVEAVYHAARAACPQHIGDFMRTYATLRLANELAGIRKLLESGEGGIRSVLKV